MSTQTPASNPPSDRSISMWRFWIPLAIQVAIVIMIPLPKAITRVVGQTVYLQTVPVDPYDVLRGHYVTLHYEISQRDTLRNPR